eukprot:4783568-Pleurochrysis_carterae.AAC.2
MGVGVNLLVAEDALGRLAPRAALVVAEAVERLQSILLRERQPPRAVATVDRSRISLCDRRRQRQKRLHAAAATNHGAHAPAKKCAGHSEPECKGSQRWD